MSGPHPMCHRVLPCTVLVLPCARDGESRKSTSGTTFLAAAMCEISGGVGLVPG